MATGNDLLKFLQGLKSHELNAELSVIGHYGEHNEMDLPEMRRVWQIGTRRYKKDDRPFVIAFPKVDIGPEPD